MKWLNTYKNKSAKEPEIEKRAPQYAFQIQEDFVAEFRNNSE